MDTIENIAENCIQCGLCVRECAFLQTYGTPGQICSAFLEGGTGNAFHACYGCNLCGLCTVVCPCELDCSGSFLQIRKQLAKGATLVDKRHKTICCGEGGAAMFVAPHIARKWKDIRSDERSENKIITYCAGCSSTFGKSFAHSHLLDLLFSPELSVQGREKVQKAPFTYLSRLFLKRRLQLINRSSTSDNKKRPASTRLRIGLLLGLVLLVTVLHLGGVTDYFHAANLNSWIHTLQGLPPIVFVGVLALTPVLFLPTFPMVMIAGVLFGQGSGLLYSLLGACLGASISFLFSRYLASDWVLSKIPESQEFQLRQLVTSHGWKMVLLLRLVPLFPFTPLNYFLGLTGIRFTHYLAATFVGILPACAAFVFFSSSVRSLWTDGTKLPVFIAGFFLLLFITGCLIAKRIILMKTEKSRKSNQRQQR